MRKNSALILFIFCSITFFAQNKDQKWQFNAGMHGVMYRYPIDIPENIKDVKNVNWGYPLSQLSVSTHLAAGFSLEMLIGANTVAQYPDSQTSKVFMANGLLNLKYSLANGYLLSNRSFIEPFFKGGVGMTFKDVKGDKFYKTIAFGGGIAFWLNQNKSFGIQFQELYQVISDVKYNKEDYFDHSVTFAYRFGFKDSDKDGIPDKRDACPTEAGIKALNGCPDKDLDGIADKNDRCPEVAGPIQFNGCPDNDGDSIPDIDDSCAMEKGPLATHGCPDKDGDLIPDKKDACPEIKGLAIYNGCPDTDNDSLPDNIDKCPKEAGPRSLDGCPPPPVEVVPDVTKEIETRIAFYVKSLFYVTGKHIILKQSYPMLDEIVNIMKEYPNQSFKIEGHTDSEGSELLNLKLSRERANAVKEYFVSKGIEPERLVADGYGMKFPVADNSSAAGRAKNRRTDITVIQK